MGVCRKPSRKNQFDITSVFDHEIFDGFSHIASFVSRLFPELVRELLVAWLPEPKRLNRRFMIQNMVTIRRYKRALAQCSLDHALFQRRNGRLGMRTSAQADGK